MNLYGVRNWLTCHTQRIFFSANFILGECTVGVLNCTIKGRRICIRAYKASLAFSVESIDVLHQKHWTSSSAFSLRDSPWIQFLSCLEALLHPESCSFDYSLLAKAFFKPDEGWAVMLPLLGLNNSNLWACCFCQPLFKVGKASTVKSDAW